MSAAKGWVPLQSGELSAKVQGSGDEPPDAYDTVFGRCRLYVTACCEVLQKTGKDDKAATILGRLEEIVTLDSGGGDGTLVALYQLTTLVMELHNEFRTDSNPNIRQLADIDPAKKTLG